MLQPAPHDPKGLDHGEVDAERLAEVWAKLDGVTDPELDESVVALNFVTEALVDAADCVHVAFRLPTYWCAANFAFLMADDMRTAVGSLPWVRGVTVRLGEHMYADTINDGLAEGRSFQDTFGAEADDDLDALRRIFLVKAYQRRQKVVLDRLEAAGYTPEAVVALTVADLAELPLDADGRAAVRRYFERRDVLGSVQDDALAFLDAEGARLDPANLPGYLRNLRRVGINAEFNSVLCKGLLSTRFDTETPFVRRSRATTPAENTSA